VLGFSFSYAFKSSFDKQGKRKSPTTAKQLGFYAWNAQCARDHAQHNPGKKAAIAKHLCAMLGQK